MRRYINNDEDDIIVPAVEVRTVIVRPENLWLTGQLKKGTKESEEIWELRGIFDSELEAVNSCNGEACFVAPIKLNEKLPIEATGKNTLIIHWKNGYHIRS